MKKYVSTILVFFNCLYLMLPSISFSNPDTNLSMTILAIKDNNIVANKGVQHGISEKMTFYIVRVVNEREIKIGAAEVALTRSTKSGLRIIYLVSGEQAKIGDILVQREVEDILSILDDTQKPENYYQDDKYVRLLENQIQEEKVEDSHNSGIVAGMAICCGLVLLLDMLAAASE
ncbi:MAG TPA: hypothetical protein PKW76_16335 [bacterium]|nr:hypothetical protein [bacterium]HPG47246.1 hypothetical protein [bacterium]HPM99548.1 hypothetical protein [bacterium]